MIIEKPGTFSEVRYFVLVSNYMNRTMFNSSGLSIGFEEYVNREVIVTYNNTEGKIGYKGNMKPGIEILTISVISD